MPHPRALGRGDAGTLPRARRGAENGSLRRARGQQVPGTQKTQIDDDAADDEQEVFLTDFIEAWIKVMTLDRFDLER